MYTESICFSLVALEFFLFFHLLKNFEKRSVSPHSYKITPTSGNMVEEVQGGIKVARGVANRPWGMQG